MKMGAPYSKDDIAFIKANYRQWSNKELGAKLNRSAASINKKRRQLKLFHTPEETKKIMQRNPNLFEKGIYYYKPPMIDPYNVGTFIF